MMPDHGDLVLRRQHHLQMAAPYRRIGAIAPAAHGGIGKDDLDPSAQPHRGRRLLSPDRLQYLQHVIRADLAAGHLADDRLGIGCERIVPLLRMLGIAPGRLIGGDVAPRRHGEADTALIGLHRLLAAGVAMGDGIDAIARELARRLILVPRLGQRDILGATQAHLARPAGQGKAGEPGALAGAAYL